MQNKVPQNLTGNNGYYIIKIDFLDNKNVG